MVVFKTTKSFCGKIDFVNLIAAAIIVGFDDVKMIIITDNTFMATMYIYEFIILVIMRKTGQVIIFLLPNTH